MPLLDWPLLRRILLGRRDKRDTFLEASVEIVCGHSLQVAIFHSLGDSIRMRCPSASIRKRPVLPALLLLNLTNEILGLVERNGVLQLVWCLVRLILRGRYRREGVCPVAFGHEFEGVGGSPGKGPLGVIFVVPIYFVRHSSCEGHCAEVLGCGIRLVGQRILDGFRWSCLPECLGGRSWRIALVRQPVVVGAVVLKPSTGLSIFCSGLLYRLLGDTVPLHRAICGVLWSTLWQVGGRVWHHRGMP
jgi:hypothetical protein